MQVRALIPFAFPRTDSADPELAEPLRNLWSFISLGLPVGVDSKQPLARLQASKQRCDALKSSPEALIQMGVQTALAKVTASCVCSCVDWC